MKPRIGITHSDEIKIQPYADAVRGSGGEPVVIAPGDTVDVETLDGLLLGGGVDVNPRLYGEKPAPETEEPNDARDRMEQTLLEVALRRDLPILAICRGMQMLNVSKGGSLAQHIEEHVVRSKDKAAPAHEVRVERGSRLAEILRAETLKVNSRHHQSLAKIGNGLRVSACAIDGTIEAIEIPEHRFALGVQWHPEDMASGDATQKKLFDEFVNASQSKRESA